MIRIKKIFLPVTVFIIALHTVNAQNWSREDSLWLKNVTEGREELKLNRETLKAIEEGNLVIPAWMKDGKANLMELIKDFEEAAQRDSLSERINPLSMPPAVFAHYVLYMDKVDSIYASATIMLSEAEKEKLRERLPPGATTIYIGNFGTGASAGTLFQNLNFNHMLSMVFSAQYRRLQHNRKHATAWKFYYDEDAVRPSFKMTESEKRRMNSEIQNRRKVGVRVKLSPNMHNGIDD